MSNNTILATTPLVSTNYLLRATGTTIGNSLIFDNGTNVGIGNTNTSYTLDVSGTLRTTSDVVLGGGSTIFGTTGSKFYIYPAFSTNLNLLQNYNGSAYTTEEHRASDYSYKIGTTAAMTITSAGNVGIGTSTTSGKLTLYQGTAGNVLQSIVSSQGGSTRVGINFCPSMADSEAAANPAQASIYATDYNYSAEIIFANKLTGAVGNALTERMRITGAGKVLIGTTTSTASYAMELGASGGGIWAKCNNSGDAQFLSYSPTIGFHYYAFTSSPIYYVLTNGDVRNANNSYGAISDIKLKENITDATPKLNDLLKVKIRNYNLISDELKTKQIGVIAQELEEVFPNMISEDIQMGSDEKIKTVKYSVFVPMLIKAMQEQQALITSLQSQINELKNK